MESVLARGFGEGVDVGAVLKLTQGNSTDDALLVLHAFLSKLRAALFGSVTLGELAEEARRGELSVVFESIDVPEVVLVQLGSHQTW